MYLQILETRPGSVCELERGRRVCVYWSSQVSAATLSSFRDASNGVLYTKLFSLSCLIT